MLDNKLELEKEAFEKELGKLIDDFSNKRNKYRHKHNQLCWVNVALNATLSFSVGISFIEEIALLFKVIALLLSSALLVVNGAMNFLNYKNMYEQRTKTLVELYALRREYRFSVKYSDIRKDFETIKNKLQSIMREDLEEWIGNVPKEKGLKLSNDEYKRMGRFCKKENPIYGK